MVHRAVIAQCGYEPSVLAFPLESSKGTWVMVNLAKDAGLEPKIIKSSISETFDREKNKRLRQLDRDVGYRK